MFFRAMDRSFVEIGLKFGREESGGVERQMFFLFFFFLSWKILFWKISFRFFARFPILFQKMLFFGFWKINSFPSSLVSFFILD